MAISKLKAEPNSTPKQPISGRRSFIRKTGTAVSAVLATAAAGVSKSRAGQDTGLKDQVARLSNRIGSLEDADAVRRLHRAYESSLSRGMYTEVVNMFADDGEAVFNGGLFRGKNSGIRRLYCEHFSRGLTGKKMEPAPGFQPDQQDMVEIAPDRRSARARFPYSMQVGVPIVSDSPLVAMARLQGQGVVQWWEGGIHEISYVKIGETWKIRRLEYRVLSKANYKPGRSYARPLNIPAFSKAYPADPTGPDRLL